MRQIVPRYIKRLGDWFIPRGTSVALMEQILIYSRAHS